MFAFIVIPVQINGSVRKTPSETQTIIGQFVDVFPDQVHSELPARSSRDFHIDLQPEGEPRKKVLYRKSPLERKERREQLHELLKTGFIRPSSSPGAAPVLFISKKDGL